MFKKLDRTLFSETLNMAWPAIVESFFVALAGIIDSAMVSSLGASAVAAVGLTQQPKNIGFAMFTAFNVSISALVARRRGEKKEKEANEILLTALIIVTLLSILMGIVFVVFADPIIRLCGSTADTQYMGVTYLRIIMGCMIFNVIQMAVNSAQRGSGKTRITMRTNLTSSAVNVVFNYLLIGGHLGFPALGITGAALATVLGTVVAAVMSLLSLFQKDSFVSIPYILAKRIRPKLRAVKDMIRIGYGIFLEQLLLRFGFMATALMAAKQGTAAMAAHQVGMNLLGLSFAFGDGLQQSAVALIGLSLGEGKPDKAKNYGHACRLFGAGISVLLAILYFFFSRSIFGIFFEEQEIIATGVNISYIIIVTVVFQIQQVIFSGSLRGAGDTLYTAIAGVISVSFIRTIVSYICCYWFHWGIIGIWCGVFADQCCRFIFMSIRFYSGKWTRIKI